MITNSQENATHIPQELRDLDQWGTWTFFIKGKSKPRKVPKKASGHTARTNAPSTWGPYEAIEQFKNKAFFFSDTDGLCGIDVDDCIDDNGVFSEDALEILEQFKGIGYAEISQSGKGFKITTRAVRDRGFTNQAGHFECYDRLRFWAMTGDVIEGHETIADGQEAVDWFCEKHLAPLLTTTSTSGPGVWEPSQLSRALSFLDPTKFRSYADWLRIMMSSHHSTNGNGLAEFIDWSTSDPEYEHAAEEIICKWGSFSVEDLGKKSTAKTILHHLRAVEDPIDLIEDHGDLLDELRLAVDSGAEDFKDFDFSEDFKDCNSDKVKRKDYVANFISAAELSAKTIVRDYFIEDFLIANEPFIVGGASKTLKTSVTLDMAISLVSGTPFLGHFVVKAPHRVAFISGESGESTLQENILSICEAKGIDPRSLEGLLMGFKLPKLDDINQVEDLIGELAHVNCKIAIIDPLYRSLRVGDSASNVYSMGEKLELIAEKIHKVNITPILNHHFRKQGRSHGEPPELEDLSQSGVAEFGRQFLLLKRRSIYNWDGIHELYFNWGGSAGHQGMKMLTVDTGTRVSGIRWNVRMQNEADWVAENKEKKELDADAKQRAKEAENEERLESLNEKIVTLIRESPGANTNSIFTSIGGRKTDVTGQLTLLVQDEILRIEDGPNRSKRYFIC